MVGDGGGLLSRLVTKSCEWNIHTFANNRLTVVKFSFEHLNSDPSDLLRGQLLRNVSSHSAHSLG